MIGGLTAFWRVLLVGIVAFCAYHLYIKDFYSRYDLTVYGIAAGLCILFALVVFVRQPHSLAYLLPGQTDIADRSEAIAFLFATTVVTFGIWTITAYVYMYVIGPHEDDIELSSGERMKSRSKAGVDASTKPPFPIDVVYTWAGENTGSDDLRTAFNQELRYSLRSVRKYLPWVNHIYILMNPPKTKPSWFVDDYAKWVTVVDQYDTFPNKDDVPSTNSNAIEFTLHNIPGLSEHFIYLNDDVFIRRPLPYTHFFLDNGKPVLSHNVKKTRKQKSILGPDHLPYLGKTPPSMNRLYLHIPFNMLKSEAQAFEEEYKGFVNWVRSQRSRKGVGADICTSVGLISPCLQLQGTLGPYMYSRKKANLRIEPVVPFCSAGYVHTGCPNKLDSVISTGYFDELFYHSPSTFVIQDTARGVGQRNNMRNKLSQFYSAKFADIPPFEKNDAPRAPDTPKEPLPSLPSPPPLPLPTPPPPPPQDSGV